MDFLRKAVDARVKVQSEKFEMLVRGLLVGGGLATAIITTLVAVIVKGFPGASH